jgi:hypothetical protein
VKYRPVGTGTCRHRSLYIAQALRDPRGGRQDPSLGQVHFVFSRVYSAKITRHTWTSQTAQAPTQIFAAIMSATPAPTIDNAATFSDLMLIVDEDALTFSENVDWGWKNKKDRTEGIYLRLLTAH